LNYLKISLNNLKVILNYFKMHEWALAQSVIYAVLEHMRENNLDGVGGFTVKLGQLQAVDRECFDFALAEIAKQEGAGGAEIKIMVESAAFMCAGCGRKWDYSESLKNLSDDVAELIHFMPEAAKAYVKCPGCGSPDYAVTRGRGVSVEEVW
jgi:hydrogenase nickel incorporation protein HypA/HybF